VDSPCLLRGQKADSFSSADSQPYMVRYMPLDESKSILHELYEARRSKRPCEDQSFYRPTHRPSNAWWLDGCATGLHEHVPGSSSRQTLRANNQDCDAAWRSRWAQRLVVAESVSGRGVSSNTTHQLLDGELFLYRGIRPSLVKHLV
jgi:hypothetical protein